MRRIRVVSKSRRPKFLSQLSTSHANEKAPTLPMKQNAKTQLAYGKYLDKFKKVFGLRTQNQKPNCCVQTQMFLDVACQRDYLDFLLYTHPKAVKRGCYNV